MADIHRSVRHDIAVEILWNPIAPGRSSAAGHARRGWLWGSATPKSGAGRPRPGRRVHHSRGSAGRLWICGMSADGGDGELRTQSRVPDGDGDWVTPPVSYVDPTRRFCE